MIGTLSDPAVSPQPFGVVQPGNVPLNPVTLTPLFANIPPLQTPSGVPINFYVAPPPPPEILPAAPSNVVLYVGVAAIIALIAIYFYVRKHH